MSNKKTVKKKQNSAKKIEQEKAEAINKIKVVLENISAEELESAAEAIAPDFDYEAEARALEIEEWKAALPDAAVTLSKYPKEKYVPKTKLGKFFIGDKHQIVMTICLVMLIALLGWQAYRWVNIYSHKVETTAKIFGEEVEFSLIPGTVRENLEYNKIIYDGDDEISPALNEEINAKTIIQVDEVHYGIEEKTEKVEYTSHVILDPDMNSGESKQTKGKDGKGIFTYATRYVNGEEMKTERSLKEWIEEPKNNVLHLGTGRTGHTGEYTVEKTFTANCSAYWMGNNCRGASGGRCVYGTVAVDRHRYPYGTLFWIEGYGFAVANDCGSAIKGDKLDLWMDSYGESCRWGRRHKTTYVLKEVKNKTQDEISRRN